MTDAVLVIVTCASVEEAGRIAERLVEERLAACGTALPGAQSVFRWQGKLCRESEVVLLLKTRGEFFERLRARVRALHSYELPEIIALPLAAGDQQYLEWLRAETSAPGKSDGTRTGFADDKGEPK